MPKTLPYRVNTATGAAYDIDFPLHAETVSPMRVNQLLSAVLERLDREIRVLGETANGDVARGGGREANPDSLEADGGWIRWIAVSAHRCCAVQLGAGPVEVGRNPTALQTVLQ